MKILITGGHSELVYDMCVVFGHKLGYDVCVAGGIDTMKRPDTGVATFHAGGIIHSEIDTYRLQYGNDVKSMISGTYWKPSLFEFVSEDVEALLRDIGERFDLVYCFLPELAVLYAKYCKVVYHLIGGEGAEFHPVINYLHRRGSIVISYSENHASFLSSLGSRIKVIHFYKDPDEWKPGHNRSSEPIVVYVANDLANRSKVCHLDWFLETRLGKYWFLAGHSNERFGSEARCLSYEAYKSLLASSRIYFNLGTEPAPYTLAVIEAAMSGLPIFTPVYQHAPGRPRYQVPELFGDGCVILPNPKRTARYILASYLFRRKKCIAIGDCAREHAIRHFGNQVLEDWANLLRR